MFSEKSLLLVTHVPVALRPDGPRIDDQTAAGIAQWCDHFDKVTYCGISDITVPTQLNSSTWVSVPDADPGGRAKIIALPWAYRPAAMIRGLYRVREILREEIARHRHLCFTIGGLVGDWPALAAFESARQRRRYSAWIDRVEPPIILNRLIDAPFKRRLAAMAMLPAMECYTHHLLRRSTVALLQGRDTFDHYARYSSDPHVTYDTHTRVADRISDTMIAAKQARILEGAPLKIIYVGRAAAMKGPSEWLSVLEQLRSAQVPFRATWVGDGPELADMHDRVVQSGLGGLVDLPGFEGDREALLRRMRESDLLLFCHKTPESPRCLIEALVSGCPLVGYRTAYPADLVGAHGGAALVPQDEVITLAAQVEALHWNRALLASLVEEAAASGRLYNEDAVYAHRAELMKLA